MHEGAMNRRAAKNADLAHRVATWLRDNGCVTTVVVVGEVYFVHYTLRQDIKPQPPVRCDGSVIFPRGSQEDVVLAFLLSQ